MAKLKVTYLDGETVEVNAGPRAQVECERRYGVNLTNKSELTIEHFYFLAWGALHFGGPEKDSDFDDFLSRIEDVDPLDDEPPDPTKPARRRTKPSA